MPIRKDAASLHECISEQVEKFRIAEEMRQIMAGGLGAEYVKAGVRMSMPEELGLLVIIERHQPGNDRLGAHEIAKQMGVRVAPFSGSARQNGANGSRMAQFSQGPVEARGVYARNLIEGINNNTGGDNSFEDACLYGGSTKMSCKASKQSCFPCARFGQNNRNARRDQEVVFSDLDLTYSESSGDMKRGQRNELSDNVGLLAEDAV